MTRLLVLALLLMPLAGEAEILHDPQYQVWSEGKNVTQEFYGRQIVMEALHLDRWPDPCLATMEAAMRAMEPFLGKKTYEVDKCVRPGGCTDKQGKRFEPGMKQWEDAAKRCWSK